MNEPDITLTSKQDYLECLLKQNPSTLKSLNKDIILQATKPPRGQPINLDLVADYKEFLNLSLSNDLEDALAAAGTAGLPQDKFDKVATDAKVLLKHDTLSPDSLRSILDKLKVVTDPIGTKTPHDYFLSQISSELIELSTLLEEEPEADKIAKAFSYMSLLLDQKPEGLIDLSTTEIIPIVQNLKSNPLFRKIQLQHKIAFSQKLQSYANAHMESILKKPAKTESDITTLIDLSSDFYSSKYTNEIYALVTTELENNIVNRSPFGEKMQTYLENLSKTLTNQIDIHSKIYEKTALPEDLNKAVETLDILRELFPDESASITTIFFNTLLKKTDTTLKGLSESPDSTAEKRMLAELKTLEKLSNKYNRILRRESNIKFNNLKLDVSRFFEDRARTALLSEELNLDLAIEDCDKCVSLHPDKTNWLYPKSLQSPLTNGILSYLQSHDLDQLDPSEFKKAKGYVDFLCEHFLDLKSTQIDSILNQISSLLTQKIEENLDSLSQTPDPDLVKESLDYIASLEKYASIRNYSQAEELKQEITLLKKELAPHLFSKIETALPKSARLKIEQVPEALQDLTTLHYLDADFTTNKSNEITRMIDKIFAALSKRIDSHQRKPMDQSGIDEVLALLETLNNLGVLTHLPKDKQDAYKLQCNTLIDKLPPAQN